MPLVLAVLMVAGIVAVLVARRTRARWISRVRGRSKQPPAGQQVRAVAHSDPHIQILTRENRNGRTHVVRIEPHGGAAAVAIQEAVR
jgi:hypothetical protein